MDIIFSFRPRNTFTNFQVVNMEFVGGPSGSVIKMDNGRILKITYEDIPAGHKIWYITGQYSTSPINQCHSTGKPHIFRFGGNRFDNHTEGWINLYDYTLGSHIMTLETSKILLPSEIFAMKNGVRSTYNGTVYLFQNGEIPVPDIDQEHRDIKEKLVFPEPHIKLFIQGDHTRPPINYFYNVWITTYAAIGCIGLCCDAEADLPVESSRETQALVVLPDNDTTQEAGEAACESIEDEKDRQDCIFDFWLIVSEIITEIEINVPVENGDTSNSTEDLLSSGLELLSLSYHQGQIMRNVLEEEIKTGSFYFLTGESIQGPSVQGDPAIMGLWGQRFKLE